MNLNKIQKDIFRSMLAGERVRKFEIDEQRVLITPSGYYGFVIPYSNVQFNLEKIATVKALDINSIISEENLCVLTKELIIMEHPPKRFARILKNGDRKIYFDQKLLDYFQNPKFYNANSTQAIVVTEDISATRKNEIVGLIMPIRVFEGEI